MTLCAAIQMASGPQVSANLLEAEKQIAEAVNAGAKLVALPENFAIMGMNEYDKVKVAEADGQGPIQEFLAATAKKYGIWIVGGTMPMQASVPNKVRAACLIYNDQGERVARYDKVHLFDVSVPDTAEEYRESDSVEAGEGSCVIDTPFGRLGVAVCYDLRFPEFFRPMARKGLDILVIPSAFTAKTGAAHWEVLLRARAIENLCYVLAPNQGGFHINGRQTYGHSMVIDLGAWCWIATKPVPVSSAARSIKTGWKKCEPRSRCWNTDAIFASESGYVETSPPRTSLLAIGRLRRNAREIPRHPPLGITAGIADRAHQSATGHRRRRLETEIGPGRLMAFTDGDKPLLILKTREERAWDMLATALKITDIEILDKNQQDGRFQVRYDPDTAGKDLSLIRTLLNNHYAEAEYLITLHQETGGIRVSAALAKPEEMESDEDGSAELLRLLHKTIDEKILNRSPQAKPEN